jgi:hypothetical protein
MHGRHAASSFAFASLFALIAPLTALTATGCLGRTGLYADEPGPDGAVIIGDDTGAQDDVPVIVDDTSVSVDSDRPPPPPVDSGRPPPSDTGINIFEVFPIPDSGPIGVCATCVANHCASSVNACVNDPNCIKGLACSVQKCLGGGGGGGGPGGFDFACLTGCFGGDLTGLLNAVSAFTCVTGTCGTDCGGLLGGLGGGIPGLPGGGGGAGGPGGTPGARATQPLQATTIQELQSIDPKLRLSIAPDAFDAWREPLARSACQQGFATCQEL